MSRISAFFKRLSCPRITCPRITCPRITCPSISLPRIACTQELVAHLLTAVVAFVALVGVGLSSAEVILGYRDCLDSPTEATECGNHFRPAVWALILELAVLVLTLAGSMMGFVEKAHHAVVGFLVLGAAGMINFSEKTLMGESNIEGSQEKVAAAGFITLAVVNVGLILWLGIQRVKSNSSGLRPVRECSPQRFALLLFVTFGVCIGAFMVGASVVEQRNECDGKKDCVNALDAGLKWWGVAVVLAVMLTVGVCEAFGILENFGTTLAALVALAAITVMDITDRSLPASGEAEDIEAAGLIVLSVVSLFVILVLGLINVGRPGVEQSGEDNTTLIIYTTLPLVFGSALTIAGVARFNNTCTDDCMGGKFNFMYWTIAFELAAVILSIVGKKVSLEILRVPSILFVVLATASQMVEVEKLFNVGDKDLGLAAAGFMLTSAMNFVLIGLLGYEGDASDWGSFALLEG
ncbi:hypothetical protein BSKO_12240 [Bryopsis sp. KO-2023]|nr:hypothetical protein BSKO_12240 [Bryopsis sp. KO-2023]